jgi:hypothetical protein
MDNPVFDVGNDEIFKRLVKEVGTANYKIFDNNETPANFIRAYFPYKAIYTCCSTNAMDIQNVSYRGLELTPQAPILVVRNMGYCNHNGEMHLNSDDNVFFAHKTGRIGRVPRKDAVDHYKKISKFAGLDHIA